MEKKLTLKAQVRTADERARFLREERLIPGVVYGKHQDAISLKVDYSDFLRLFRAAGKSHIIELNLSGKTIEVLVHEIDRDPVKGDYTHIDFFAITKGEKVTTSIPLSFIGLSKAAMESGAIIEKHLEELKVKVLPKDLIDTIEVNLEKLENVGDFIRVSDLNIDTNKFEILEDVEAVVASANKPKEEKIEEVVVETPAEGAAEAPAEAESKE